MAPVPVAPSPKSHAYEASEPSGSLEPEPSTVTTRKFSLVVKAAAGRSFVTVIGCVTVPVPPLLSVTVKVTE